MKTKGFIRKTVLSVALLVAMVMSMLAGAVMASAETPTYSEQEIDPNKTGSVTVTKYVANETLPDKTDGTGLSGQTVADGYSPLQGAEFVLIQVENIEFLKKFYDGQTHDDISVPSLTDFEYIPAQGENLASYKWKSNAINADKIHTTAATNANGVCTFSELPLGIYVLMEISAPSQIGVKAVNSLISIPMVNSETSDNTGTAEKSMWLYDIHVYPKNQASDSTVVVTKVGNNGTTALTAGVTNFKLYAVDFTENKALKKTSDTADAPVDWKPYPDENNNTFSTNTSDGKATIGNLKAGQYGTQFKLVEVSAPAGFIVDSTPIYFYIDKDRIIHWNQSTDTNGCVNQDFGDRFPNADPTDTNNVTDNKTLAFNLRNIQPTFNKKVASNPDQGTSSWGNDAQYAINETIKYQLQFDAPANASQLKNLIVTDIPQKGIRDDSSTITISTGSPTTQLTKDTHYTVEAVNAADDNGTGFKVTFTPDGKTAVQGKSVSIEYSAKLNGDAVIAQNGNQNTAQLDYSTRFGSDTEDDNNKLYTIKDSANVYTFQYKVTKYKDSVADTNKLSGEGDKVETVQFQLLDTNKNIIKVVAVDSEKGIYRLADATETGDDTMTTGTKVVKNEDPQAVTEDYRGTLTIQGLAKTTTSNQYFLKEVKTITGYNLLSSPFPIEVDISHGTTWTDNSTWNDKTLTKKVFSAPDLKKGETAKPDGLDEGSVINKKGFVLPQTGSMGYLLFCTVGIVLVAGGTVMLFGTRKKKIR